jgi:hypothetical protein
MVPRSVSLALAAGLALVVTGCEPELGGGGSSDPAGDNAASGGGSSSASSDTSGGGAPQFPGAGGGAGGLAGGTMVCFYPADGSGDAPAATMEWALEADAAGSAVHARLTLSPYFVDNTYGANSIGWGHRGHTFGDLYRSDHAEFLFSDGGGTLVLDFKVDYITEDATSPSGWSSLGIAGGDGAVLTGDPALVLDTMTSLDRNFNERGYAGYTVDSPATDEGFSPNPAAPAWDYRVVYEAWVDSAAFGGAGFGSVLIDHVHASPSKDGTDTVQVVAGDCPDNWGCFQGDCGDLPGGGSGTDEPPQTPDCPYEEGCDLCVQNSDCAPGKSCVSGICLPDIL